MRKFLLAHGHVLLNLDLAYLILGPFGLNWNSVMRSPFV